MYACMYKGGQGRIKFFCSPHAPPDETSNAVSSFPSASYDIDNQPHQPIYDAGYQVLDILSREIYILEMYRINQNVK